ncbi:MAG: hypothetical protein Q9218_000629 [Villophora microphyllina]
MSLLSYLSYSFPFSLLYHPKIVLLAACAILIDVVMGAKRRYAEPPHHKESRQKATIYITPLLAKMEAKQRQEQLPAQAETKKEQEEGEQKPIADEDKGPCEEEEQYVSMIDVINMLRRKEEEEGEDCGPQLSKGEGRKDGSGG